jgi:phosphoglycolate phosphatase-like HAD superfamily hydrolase
MNKLILFDIDRTLAHGPRAHQEAFKFSFKKIYGVNSDVDVVDLSGKTDQQIIIDVLRFNNLEKSIIMQGMKACIKEMSDYYEKDVKPGEVSLLDGVKELLNKLDKMGFILGLVTGNLESIAHRKLKIAGIDHYFKIGGFGSDHILRHELVKLAINRAKKKYGFKLEGNNVFIVDDSLRGVEAGLKAGVKVIGVATGKFKEVELKSAGAHLVLSSLKESDKFLDFLL